jgi:ABC-type multidrug transport system fused ATPase/permease subunit
LSVLTGSEKKQWGLLTVLTLLISVADIASLALLIYIVHFYTAPAAALPPISFMPHSMASSWLFNQHSIALIALFFVFFSLKNIAAYFINAAQNKFVYRVASRISRNNLLHYLEGNYTDYIHTDTSLLTRKISLQPLEFAQHVLASMQQVFTEGALIVLTIIAIVLFNAQLFLLLLLLLLPPVFIAGWFTKRKLAVARNFIKSSRTAMWQHLHESITGFVESNIFGRNLYFTNRYATAQDTLNRHQSALQSTQALPARLTEIFAVFGLLALIAISQLAGPLKHAGEVVTLGAFIAAAYKIIPGITRILNGLGQMRTYAFTLNDLLYNNTLIATPVTSNSATPPIHSIAFDQVCFQYNDHIVLHQFCCTLQTGDFVGIQGHSGKGKTTLLNILLGFIKPGQGKVLINNQVTSEQQRQQYWKQIAYVKQQPFFMHDTLLANITMNGQQYNTAQFQQAVDIAGMHHWMNNLPQTLDTVVTENGRNISGGQRQRIALARALYKNANVIILDEPFSELDEQSEQKVLQHLQQMAASGKIVILITHNTKSLSFCNKIVAI